MSTARMLSTSDAGAMVNFSSGLPEESMGSILKSRYAAMIHMAIVLKPFPGNGSMTPVRSRDTVANNA